MSVNRSKRGFRGFPQNKSEKLPLGSYFYIVVGPSAYFRGIGNTRTEVSAPAVQRFRSVPVHNKPAEKTIKVDVKGPFLLFTKDKNEAKKYRTQLQAQQAVEQIKKKFPDLCSPTISMYDKDRTTKPKRPFWR